MSAVDRRCPLQLQRGEVRSNVFSEKSVLWRGTLEALLVRSNPPREQRGWVIKDSAGQRRRRGVFERVPGGHGRERPEVVLLLIPAFSPGV